MKQEKEWPREILIRPTIETARRSMPKGYNEDDEGDDAILYEVGQLMESVEIESWADFQIPPGYEFDDDDERNEYELWLQLPGNELRWQAWLARAKKGADRDG